MERKRKLPARAAAREHVSKKRTVTPPDTRSQTPAPAPPVDEPPAPLPRSIQAGKPLPTVEDAQPEDLPMKDFQSIQESGVLAESLHRSRQKWISEGIFEKYWTKPVKRKGVTIEEPNNPPKDTMQKLGQVTIAVGPQAFEATVFSVKDPKPPPPPTAFRPIIQYGPPSGGMPPPATPASTQKAVTPVQTSAQPSPTPEGSRPPSTGPTEPYKAAASPRATCAAPVPGSTATPAAPAEGAGSPLAQPAVPATSASRPTSSSTQASTAAKPPATKPANTDPIIVTLAEKASDDPHLRDLMKKVAQGTANPTELTQFQKIIDQITTEYKMKGGQQGPSADRLLVDGRTVQWFADEVRVILDLVLRANPLERSSTLKPPERSDPLIISLVKHALDNPRSREIITRVADGKPGFTDTTDLKAILDGLHTQMKGQRTGTASPAPGQSTPNGLANGHAGSSGPSQQALRSKGPPPAPKNGISALVFEFSGGNGDRYLFPKYSILEYLPGGQQVIASFLIVRKGSPSDYGCDPTLDYYERITIRLYSSTGKHLDLLSKVVAPQDEVQRYMNEIMDTATRAEYILLAFRLPRGDKEGDGADGAAEEQPSTNGSTPKPGEGPSKQPATHPGILWAMRRSPSPSRGGARKGRGMGKSKEEKGYGISALKPRFQPREPSPPVFSLRKGLQGYSDAEASQYANMAQGLAARKEPEA